MIKNIRYNYLGVIFIALFFTSCSIPALVQRDPNKIVPASYNNVQDTTNSATTGWKTFFDDPYLIALIDTALKNNQELNIILQEINMSQNEVKARKGEYLPFVTAGAATEVEKVGRYTSQGASDAQTEVMHGKEFPEPLPDFMIGANVSWELDVWKKLRNAKQAAVLEYLSSIEGKNFMVTNLVSEISHLYYELLALDNQLLILQRNIDIQKNALKIVKLQKTAAKVTELAVRKFEAEVLKNQSNLYDIQQRITETENMINFLVGRYPQPIARNAQGFTDMVLDTITAGVPSQLLANRPDIKQAEMELEAAKLDVKVAKANFYPSVRLMAGAGYQAFNLAYLITTPESMLYSLAGDLVAPLVNRNAIKATYLNANAKQIQTVYEYEQTILTAYIEVVNQLSNIDNLKKSYNLRSQQVDALTESIAISTRLFKSARADYMEVLLTQRDALEAKMELIETKQRQINALVKMYKALGGGWK